MSKLQNHLAFVKEQILFQERMAKRYSNDEYRKNLHLRSAEKLSALERDLTEADYQMDSGSLITTTKIGSLSLTLTAETLEGLPDELIQELSISDADRTEFTIINVIDENGGAANLDKILIGVYRKTGEILKRNALNAKIYRMVQKDMILSVPGKKGVYSSRELLDEEIINLK